MPLETLEEEEFIVLLEKKVIILLKKEADKNPIEVKEVEVQDFRREELLIEVLIKNIQEDEAQEKILEEVVDIREKIIIMNTLEMEEADLVDMKEDQWEMVEVEVQDIQEVNLQLMVLEKKPTSLVLGEVGAEELHQEKVQKAVLVEDLRKNIRRDIN